MDTNGHEEKRKSTKGIHEGARRTKRYPRRGTKDHEGPLRGWRWIDRGSPRVGKGGEDVHEGRKGKGKKISTKGHEGVGGGSRGIRQRSGRGKRFPGKGKKISTKGHEGVGGGSRGIRQGSGRGSAKELQGVGKDSKGVREGRRRTAKGEKISTKDTGAIHKVDPGTGRSQNYVPVVRSQRRA